jgi:drug/metabolite transporter (DMT)-like permease
VASVVLLHEGFDLAKVVGALVLLAGVYLAHR